MINVKITGLDKLQRQLEEAQRGLESLNGKITTLQFSPDDPASVRRALQQMESAVDDKVSLYSGNPLVAKVAEMTKQNFRQRILARAKMSA
jgi:hypothetical protein